MIGRRPTCLGIVIQRFVGPENGTIHLPVKATKATLLAGGSALQVSASATGTSITLPDPLPDPTATVIQIETE